MNFRTLFASAVTAILLGCTTPLHYPSAAAIPLPASFRSWTLIATPERQDFTAARVCLLSTTGSCMELDSHPFEPCLVASKTCDQKGGEIIRVSPLAIVGPARAESR